MDYRHPGMTPEMERAAKCRAMYVCETCANDLVRPPGELYWIGRFGRFMCDACADERLERIADKDTLSNALAKHWKWHEWQLLGWAPKEDQVADLHEQRTVELAAFFACEFTQTLDLYPEEYTCEHATRLWWSPMFQGFVCTDAFGEDEVGTHAWRGRRLIDAITELPDAAKRTIMGVHGA